LLLRGKEWDLKKNLACVYPKKKGKKKKGRVVLECLPGKQRREILGNFFTKKEKKSGEMPFFYQHQGRGGGGVLTDLRY